MIVLLALVAVAALLTALLPQANTAQAAGNVIYVNINAAPGGDGATWATAYKYLQDALNAANVTLCIGGGLVFSFQVYGTSATLSSPVTRH